MIIVARAIALASLVTCLTAAPGLTQSGTATGDAKKADTNCNAPSTVGSAQQSTTSMAIEKSAILPSAGGHANSAAPTVQSDGKGMQARADCPPDTTSPAPSGK